MITTEQINRILNVNDSYKQPAKLLDLMLDDKKRVETFLQFLEIETNMSYEWFQEAYELEHADRKGGKQDFTPHALGKLLSRLVIDASPIHYFEAACGNGGIMINHWNEQRLAIGIANYNPTFFWYMAIRGINGVILHGDSIAREFKDVYFIRNMREQYGAFSEVIKMEKTEILMNELNIGKWV